MSVDGAEGPRRPIRERQLPKRLRDYIIEQLNASSPKTGTVKRHVARSREPDPDYRPPAGVIRRPEDRMEKDQSLASEKTPVVKQEIVGPQYQAHRLIVGGSQKGASHRAESTAYGQECWTAPPRLDDRMFGGLDEEDDCDSRISSRSKEAAIRAEVAELKVQQEKRRYEEECRLRDAQHRLSVLKEQDECDRAKLESRLWSDSEGMSNIKKELWPKRETSQDHIREKPRSRPEKTQAHFREDPWPQLPKSQVTFHEEPNPREQTHTMAPDYRAGRAESEEIRKFFQGVAKPSLPKFSGEKWQFPDWWEQYEVFVHHADVPTKFKMVMLKNCLTGKAMDLVKGLGFTETQYMTAIKKLHERYGGEKRILQSHIEIVSNVKPMELHQLEDLEKFANLLQDMIAKLYDAGQDSELDGQSTLYLLVQQRIPEELLISFRTSKAFETGDGLENFVDWFCKQINVRIEMSDLKGGLSKKFRSKDNFGTKGTQKAKSYSHSTTSEAGKPPKMERPLQPGPVVSQKSCPVCSMENHTSTTKCYKWIRSSIQDRWKLAKEKKICYRCLRAGHLGKTCGVSEKCGIDGCEKTHHRTLHVTHKVAEPRESKNSPDKSATAFGVSNGVVVPSKVALRLIPVLITGSDGVQRKVHAFLDDGSDSTYVRASLVQELGLAVEDKPLTVATITSKGTIVDSGLVQIVIESLDGATRQKLGARTLNRLCEGLRSPDWTKLKAKWPHLREIEFPALEGYRSVDILIGSDHPELTLSLEERVGKPGEPVARKTPLGWTCVGSFAPSHSGGIVNFSQSYCSSVTMDKELQKLWNMDVIRSDPIGDFTPEEKSALTKASNSLKYVGDRYQTSIPWKGDRPSLPDNRIAAEKRLKSLEASLNRKPEVAERYREVFKGNVEKGYITEIPHDETYKPGWYLPHFGVIKEDRVTTKVRVVYDGAAICEGKSLNNEMLPGPKLQQDIVDILINFRRGAVALVGDIKEMFSQIVLDPDDRRYHRILWRDMDTNSPIRTFEAVRLPFGDRASPFLAQHVIRTHAEENLENFPLAAEICLNSLYMDDALSSRDDAPTVKKLREELTELLKKAGFSIRKWVSNSIDVLQDIPEDDRAPGLYDLNESELPSLKVLGVHWNAKEDVFGYSHSPVELQVVTKRTLLSLAARLFDPLQLLAPFVVRAKMMLQQAWIDGLDWDEPFPAALGQQARVWAEELPSVESFKIPRCYHKVDDKPIKTEIHTFTDASSLAYGAVVFIRNLYSDGSVTVRRVLAKAGVAPLKSISIPRLELMGAILGLRLAMKVKELLGYTSLRFWTDSMDVIHWIHGQSRRYKPFVAHRVGEIQEHTSPQQWCHVPGSKNPADLATRGAKMEDLSGDSSWTTGPAFLYQEEEHWPPRKDASVEQLSEKAQEEIPKSQSHATSSSPDPASLDQLRKDDGTSSPIDHHRYSSMARLVRVTAWVLRYVRILRTKVRVKSSELEASELDEAELYWVRQVQQEELGFVFKNLSADRTCTTGKLKPLLPFVDSSGFVRVGGRLQNSDLSFDTKHPYVIPQRSHLAFLIVRRAHFEGEHVCGVNATLADIRQKYWIVHGREEVKKYERDCLVCVMRRKRFHKQVMAPLPGHRVTVPVRAFARTGVDYAGPYIVKITRRVNAKRWLCLFTCTASRAVHLEVAYSMETDSFLHAFSRMSARRGKPELVVSDNGSNFQGANRELKELIEALDKDLIKRDAANRGIEWRFNPPYGSHHGGLFEAMIKSAKRALKAILGETRLTDEELLTAVVEVEGLLNSRPLTYCSDDPKDEPVLTPNHFLIGQAGGQLAPRVAEDLACSPRHRWKYVQQLVTQVWRRWNKEFLSLLQTRGKWLDIKEDLEVGDVVLVADPGNPKGKWPLGRVVETFPCQDQHVRSVRVQSSGKTFIRPICKLCPLKLTGQNEVANTPSLGHGGESVDAAT